MQLDEESQHRLVMSRELMIESALKQASAHSAASHMSGVQSLVRSSNSCNS